MSDLKLWKAIWEIRYPAAASLFDQRGNIATNWQFHHNHEELTEWQISSNKVSVYNPSKTLVLNAGLGSAGVTQEIPVSYRQFSRLAADFSIYVINQLSIKVIKRLGLRLMYLAERKSFPGLVKKISRKLIRLEGTGWDIEDIGLPLTFKMGQNKANFNFGPMEKEQFSRDKLFNTDEALKKIPPVTIFVDFDLYRLDPTQKPPQSLINEFLESGEREIKDRVDKFLEAFGGF